MEGFQEKLPGGRGVHRPNPTRTSEESFPRSWAPAVQNHNAMPIHIFPNTAQVLMWRLYKEEFLFRDLHKTLKLRRRVVEDTSVFTAITFTAV